MATGLSEIRAADGTIVAASLDRGIWVAGVVQALLKETSPGIAGLLSAAVEKFARASTAKKEYGEFERILETLESAPKDDEHAHISTLVAHILGDEQWLYLVDEALSGQPLNPVIPRLLKRLPGPVDRRLGLLLTSAEGLDSLPAMVRLIHGTGEPVLGALETRLYEARRQRIATSIHLLASADPKRLAGALPQGAGQLGVGFAGPGGDGTHEVDESACCCGDGACFSGYVAGSACDGRALHDRPSRNGT